MKKFLILFLLIAMPCFAYDLKRVDVVFQDKDFVDAIHYNSEDAWNNRDLKKQDEQIQERIANHKYAIEHPAPTVEVVETEETLTKETEDIDAQIASLEARKVEVSQRLQAKPIEEAPVEELKP